jgi:hypothetical protein
MKIVQGDELEWKRGLQHRGGTFHYRNLMEGKAGTIGNFQLSLGRSDKDFLSPRHRHNFEQFRFVLEGELKFGRDGAMKSGMVGYFPEGTYYGPQTQEDEALAIVLQFGGASGQGYLSRADVMRGTKDLESYGRFEDGVFRRNSDAEGKRNLDAYEAIWEHINGRRLEYPAARYPGPILMDEANFSWVPSKEGEGVWEKPLGCFTERRAEAGFLKVEKGATAVLPSRSVHVCRSGAGTVEGEPLRALTVVYVSEHETAQLTASAECKFIRMLLPDLAGLETSLRNPERVAAE